MGNPREKINLLWFGMAFIVALFVGSIFNSFGVAVIAFVITFAYLLYNGEVRPNSQGRRRP